MAVSPSVSCAILAGGMARRMGGENKAFLSIGGEPIIERVLSALRPILPDIMLITNQPEVFRELELPMYGDIRPGAGSLGGIYTALCKASTKYVFLTACDMPFLKTRIIRRIIERIDGYDVVIPQRDGRLEPLHAIYSKRCIPFIERLLDVNDLKILNFFNEVDVLTLDVSDFAAFDPDLHFLMNINSPADLEAARLIASVETPHPPT